MCIVRPGGWPKWCSMSVYGQFCPIAKTSEIFAERWTPLILRELMCGSTRFNELRRGVPLMSPSLLSSRLKALAASGIIESRPLPDGKGHEYVLTAAGEEFRPIVEALGAWGMRWTGKLLEPVDFDPQLLVWDIRRRLDTSSMPDRRIVIEFRFADVARARRLWWIMVERREAVVCLEPPPHEPDVYVSSSVRGMAAVWMGDRTMADALRSGDVQLEGRRADVRAFPGWLRLSLFAVSPRGDRGFVEPARARAR